ncbi:MAG: hypothetical protein ACJAUL_001853 [Paraglaciecola sp.]|jgi:hypothetical protein
MQKQLTLIVFTLTLGGCASQYSTSAKEAANDISSNESTAVFTVPPAACLGNTELPPSLAGQFTPVSDPSLLANATAPAGEGKLCQGQVYQANDGEKITVYRAWNSRNSYTRLGSWWAANKPAGKTSDYQTNYEICYIWSPLDKMVQCDLKPGTKVVIGTGQSTFCAPPPPAKYPSTYILEVSAKKQVYIENTADVVTNCRDFNNEFSWAAAQ